MKESNRWKRLKRCAMVVLTVMLVCSSLAFAACKQPADKEPEVPPAQGETGCNGNHSFGEWETVKAATCETDGERLRTCGKCGETEREAIPAAHTLTDVAEVAATCEGGGVKAHKHCSVCEKDFIDGEGKTAAELVIPATGHHYREVRAVEATCHQDGIKAHLFCEGCGDRKVRGVSYTAEELKIPATHHIVRLGEVAPTCTEDGVMAHTYCYVCTANFVGEEEKTEAELAIPAAHDLKTIPEAAHTCEEDGVKAHEHCVKCGKNFLDGEVATAADLRIPAAHEYGDLIAATETERAHYPCKHCDKTFVKFSEGGAYYEVSDLTPVGENYRWTDGTPATCETDGVRAHYEVREEGSEETLYYDENLYFLPAEDLILPSGHLYVKKCIDKDEHEEVCARCGAHGEQEQHNMYGEIETIDGKQYEYFYCTDCDFESDRRLLPDAGKTFYQIAPFILGNHSVDNYYIGFTEPGGSGYALMSWFDFDEAEWNRICAEAESAGSYPVTKTLRVSYAGCTQDIEFVFDQYKCTVEPFFPVYQQGYLSALERVGVIITSNLWDFGAQSYTTILNALLSDSRVTITDDGGFDVNADLTGGDKTYTVKFSVREETYEVSFRYTAEQTVGKIFAPSDTLQTVKGRYPSVGVVYTDRYDRFPQDFLSLEAFDIVGGSFDCNKLGWQEATFALGAYAQITLRIYVADPDEIETVDASSEDHYTYAEYYVEKGADFVDVRVTYYNGKTGTIRIPTANLRSDPMYTAFDINEAGEYYVCFLMNDTEYGITVYVYDPENLAATDISWQGFDDVEWLYESDGNGGYVLKYDLSGLFLEVSFADGTEATLPVTEEMFSYNKAWLAEAIANGDDRLTIMLTYRGWETSLMVSIVGTREVKRIRDVLRDGENTEYLFVKDGTLYGTYRLTVKGASGYYEIPLTADMLYVENDDEELERFSVADAAKGEYDIVISHAGKTKSTTLVVFDDDDITYSLSPTGFYTLAGTLTGTKEEVLAAFDGRYFVYLTQLQVPVKNGLHFVTLEEKTISVADMTIENVDEIDFAAAGRITLVFAYAGETYEYPLLLSPDLSLYTYKEYVFYDDPQQYLARLYENGFFEMENAYSTRRGLYTIADEANGVYELEGRQLYVLPDGKTMDYWSGRAFGEKNGIAGERYDRYGETLVVYLKDSTGYADEMSGDGTYILDTLKASMENGILLLDGIKYTVTEQDGVKVLRILTEGNTLYRYEEENENREQQEKYRSTFVFNDNGKTYIVYETAAIPEGGTEYGAFEMDYEYCVNWRRDGDDLVLEMGFGYEARFHVNEDGTLTPLDRRFF